MHLRMGWIGLLLVACPPAGGGADTGSTGDVATTGGAPTTGDAPTTGGASVECINGGIGAAFAWAKAPDPGVAQCLRITDDLLMIDCTGDFTGIFTLELANSGPLGILSGDMFEVDYRVTKTGDAVTGEWLRIRDQVQWWIVAAQGPTVAPPDAPDDWFHPNVDVAVAASDCAEVTCSDGSGAPNTPRAIAFGEVDPPLVLAPGQDGNVPGEFGGESYHAVVTEARTGLCGDGDPQTDHFAFSVVSSGFL